MKVSKLTEEQKSSARWIYGKIKSGDTWRRDYLH